MKMKNWIFFTGAPGSHWSGVSQHIRDHGTNVDNTDLVPEKQYTHHRYSGHKGNYYGPGMLNGQWLDRELGSWNLWQKEIAKSYLGKDDDIKLILSHNFAYYLNDIKETFQGSKIVMCYRPDDECYKWWHEAGGWDISYPSYEWYRDNTTMDHQITEQNKAILDFCYKHNLTLRKPGREWLRNEFNIDADFIFEKDVWIAVYDPN